MHGRRQVEHRAPRLEAVEEPDPLLREGKRQGALARHRLEGPQGRSRLLSPTGAESFDLQREAGDLGELEEPAQR